MKYVVRLRVMESVEEKDARLVLLIAMYIKISLWTRDNKRVVVTAGSDNNNLHVPISFGPAINMTSSINPPIPDPNQTPRQRHRYACASDAGDKTNYMHLPSHLLAALIDLTF